MRTALTILVITLFSCVGKSQYNAFAWDLYGEFKSYQSSVLVETDVYDFSNLGNSAMGGFGIKRSIGYVDNVLNIGVLAEFGSGSYSKRQGQDKFRNYQLGVLLDYEKAIGLKSTVHPYSTYPILSLGMDYIYHVVDFHSMNLVTNSKEQVLLKASNPRLLFGGGFRFFSHKNYKGTLKASFYYDLTVNNWNSSVQGISIKSMETFGIRLNYSVSS